MQIPQTVNIMQISKKKSFMKTNFEPPSMQNDVDCRRHVKLSAIKSKIFKLALQSVTI